MRLILPWLWVIFLLFALTACHAPFTRIKAGLVSLSHDQNVKDPPRVSSDTSRTSLPVPAGATVKVTKTEEIPATDKLAAVPSVTTTIIELPKNAGMELVSVQEKVAIIGSGGFAPPKGPTPTEKANAWWTYAGIAICALGLFFCTPWGGSNYRVGGIIAAGGIGMAVIGRFIDQINLPAPAIFSVFVIIALAVYYGYRVRHNQIQPTV